MIIRIAPLLRRHVIDVPDTPSLSAHWPRVSVSPFRVYRCLALLRAAAIAAGLPLAILQRAHEATRLDSRLSCLTALT